MISKQMIDWGESGCSIREIAAYGERRAAQIGPENVYNFAIGNPSIDPPDCVHAAVERLLRTVPPTQLHAYAPATVGLKRQKRMASTTPWTWRLCGWTARSRITKQRMILWRNDF